MSLAKTWTKKALIPLWCLHIIVLLIYVGVVAVATHVDTTAEHVEFVTLSFLSRNSLTNVNYSGSIALLVVSVVCLLLEIGEIVAFAAFKSLGVIAYFVLQLVKMTIWLVLLIMTAVGLAYLQSEDPSSDEYGALGIFIALILYILLL